LKNNIFFTENVLFNNKYKLQNNTMTPDIENGLLNEEYMNEEYYIHENLTVPDEIVIEPKPYYFTPINQIRSRPILEPPKLVRQYGQKPLKVYQQNNQIIWLSMRQPMF